MLPHICSLLMDIPFYLKRATPQRFLAVHGKVCIGLVERRDTTRRHFNVRRLLAFDARLASIHLLQFPRRFSQVPPPLPRKREEKPTPTSKFRVHLVSYLCASLSFRFASPRSRFCVLFICALAVQTIYNFNAHTGPATEH